MRPVRLLIFAVEALADDAMIRARQEAMKTNEQAALTR
jgi:hypothetical protein